MFGKLTGLPSAANLYPIKQRPPTVSSEIKKNSVSLEKFPFKLHVAPTVMYCGGSVYTNRCKLVYKHT